MPSIDAIRDTKKSKKSTNNAKKLYINQNQLDSRVTLDESLIRETPQWVVSTEYWENESGRHVETMTIHEYPLNIINMRGLYAVFDSDDEPAGDVEIKRDTSVLSGEQTFRAITSAVNTGTLLLLQRIEDQMFAVSAQPAHANNNEQ